MNEMNLLLNVAVLVFEVLYYALFMKFARKEGKFWRYLLLFILATILIMFLGTNTLISYLIFVLFVLYGLKYIIRTKVSLYEMCLITIMLLSKLIIEIIIMVVFYNLFKFNHFATTLIFSSMKVLLVFLFKKELNLLNNRLKKLWNNNNFYIRYLFSIVFYIYVIVSIISAFWLIVI